MITTMSRRLVAAISVLTATIATLMLFVAPPANAQSCRTDKNAVICLGITKAGPGIWDVHIGIDVTMSQSDAQAIIDAPGEPFSAKTFGEDPAFDNALFSVPVSWVSAWSGGLSAEFDIRVGGNRLDEDNSWTDNKDDVYAKVWLVDARINRTHEYRSVTLHEHYER
ncbi:hypothetical protein AB0K48_17515 [Nonomuraea sp. NPDC055795]